VEVSQAVHLAAVLDVGVPFLTVLVPAHSLKFGRLWDAPLCEALDLLQCDMHLLSIDLKACTDHSLESGRFWEVPCMGEAVNLPKCYIHLSMNLEA
jgi:hypothetical protein